MFLLAVIAASKAPAVSCHRPGTERPRPGATSARSSVPISEVLFAAVARDHLFAAGAGAAEEAAP
eukprot:8503919-Prorocentrum_lima.AAC.1